MVMLCKVIPYIKGAHEQLLQKYLVRLSLGQHVHEFIPVIPRRGLFVRHASEVLLRDRVDDCLPLLDPLLTVQVQDRVVGFAVPYPSETVEETATIDEAPRDAEPTPWVAEVRSVGGEENAADSEFGCASLMHLVGRNVDQLVLVRFGVTWEHGLELPWLPLLVLFNRQPSCFAISDAVKSIPGNLCCHLRGRLGSCIDPLKGWGKTKTYKEVFGMDDEIGIVEAKLPLKVIISLLHRSSVQRPELTIVSSECGFTLERILTLVAII